MTIGCEVIIESDELKRGTVVEMTEHLFAVQMPIYSTDHKHLGYGIFWYKKTVPHGIVQDVKGGSNKEQSQETEGVWAQRLEDQILLATTHQTKTAGRIYYWHDPQYR